MVKQAKTIGLTLAAVLAVSSAAATVAQAAPEGPFYKIGGKRLAAGEKAEGTAKAATEFVLKASVITMRAKKLKTEKGVALGSSGPNSATGESVTVFEEVTVEGNGEGCKVAGGQIKTELSEGVVGFSEKEPAKGTPILGFARPKKGGVFAKVKFEGANCKITETAIEGTTAAETWSGGKVVRVEEEPAETVIGESNSPATPIKTVFWQKEGKWQEQKIGLKAFGATVTITGRSEGELVSKEKGGVFSV